MYSEARFPHDLVRISGQRDIFHIGSPGPRGGILGQFQWLKTNSHCLPTFCLHFGDTRDYFTIACMQSKGIRLFKKGTFIQESRVLSNVNLAVKLVGTILKIT